MTRMFLAVLLLLVSAGAGAQGGRDHYVSDEITLAIREAPRGDAPTIGTVKSGARVSLLRTLGPESFSQIRTSEGLTGWVTARYISGQPAARDQLAERNRELRDLRGRVQALERELDSANQRLSQAQPAFELAQDNTRLRAAIAQHEREREDMQRRFDEEGARRRTLLVGAGLVGAGMLLGLLLPWMASGRRRRYSEL